MASLSQLTYNILNIYRSGITSDDETVSNRQIAFWIGYYRAMFIKRELDNRKKLSRKLFQDLGCIKLVETDKAECCDTIWGCKVLKTDKPIPNMIQQGFIGLVDKSTSIPLTTNVQSNWFKYNKYTGSLRQAYWNTDYVYVINSSRLREINVQGIFSDPLAAAQFSDCDGKPCFTWDSEYPLPEEFIAPITEMIITKEGRFTFSTSQDSTNDGPKEIPKG